jgi:hypothetical protein
MTPFARCCAPVRGFLVADRDEIRVRVDPDGVEGRNDGEDLCQGMPRISCQA